MLSPGRGQPRDLSVKGTGRIASRPRGKLMVTGKEDRKHGCPRDTEKRLSLTVLGEASAAVKALAGRQCFQWLEVLGLNSGSTTW